MTPHKFDRDYFGFWPAPTNAENLEHCELPHEFRLEDGVYFCRKCHGVISTVDFANYRHGLKDAAKFIMSSRDYIEAVTILNRSTP